MAKALEVLENIFKSGLSLILISSYIVLGGLESLGWKFGKHYIDTMQTAFFIGVAYNFGVEIIAVIGANFKGLKLVQNVMDNTTTTTATQQPIVTNTPIVDNTNTTGNSPQNYQMYVSEGCPSDSCPKKF